MNGNRIAIRRNRIVIGAEPPHRRLRRVERSEKRARRELGRRSLEARQHVDTAAGPLGGAAGTPVGLRPDPVKHAEARHAEGVPVQLALQTV